MTLNTATGSFDILLDPVIVSDDELAAALHHQGYDLTSWQEVRATHAVQQRTWLLEQIRSFAVRAEHELADRGTYADAVMKGSVEVAYVAGRVRPKTLDGYRGLIRLYATRSSGVSAWSSSSR